MIKEIGKLSIRISNYYNMYYNYRFFMLLQNSERSIIHFMKDVSIKIPGPELKLFSRSTQLGMKFQLLKESKILKNKIFFLPKSL